MPLVHAISRYTFTSEQLGSWRGYWRSKSTESALHATFELLGPSSSSLLSGLNVNAESALQVFRWSVAFESLIDGLKWPRHLADEESVIIQLLFELPPGIVISEISGSLEHLAPTRPLRPSWVFRFARRLGDIIIDIGSKAIPHPLADALSSSASPIPSRDTRDNVLWYLRRFFVTEGPAYGVEWRITSRLIEEIGSRWTGTLGVVFLETDACEEDSAPATARKPRAVGRLGLKPRYMRNWLDFHWRPGENEKATTIPLTFQPPPSQPEDERNPGAS